MTGPEIIGCVSLSTFMVLASPNRRWDTFETVITCVVVVALILCGVQRFWEHRLLVDNFWKKYGGQP